MIGVNENELSCLNNDDLAYFKGRYRSISFLFKENISKLNRFPEIYNVNSEISSQTKISIIQACITDSTELIKKTLTFLYKKLKQEDLFQLTRIISQEQSSFNRSSLSSAIFDLLHKLPDTSISNSNSLLDDNYFKIFLLETSNHCFEIDEEYSKKND